MKSKEDHQKISKDEPHICSETQNPRKFVKDSRDITGGGKLRIYKNTRINASKVIEKNNYGTLRPLATKVY